MELKYYLIQLFSDFDGKNVIVKKSAKSTSTIKSKTIIPSYTLLWAAGVTPVEIIKKSVFKTMKGQVIVNEFLEIPNFLGVFAIGDCSRFDESINKSYPPTAQLAEAHAKLAAYNIKQIISNNEKKKFEYNWKGQSAIIGKRSGITEVMGSKVTGFWAWFNMDKFLSIKNAKLRKKIKSLVGFEYRFVF